MKKSSNYQRVQGSQKLDGTQMVVKDSAKCEDGGKMIQRETVPYEVEPTMSRLKKQWIDERLKKGKDLLPAVESESSSTDNVIYCVRFTTSYSNHLKQKIVTSVVGNRQS